MQFKIIHIRLHINLQLVLHSRISLDRLTLYRLYNVKIRFGIGNGHLDIGANNDSI